MMSHCPNRKSLPFSFTLWNEIGEGKVINGRRSRAYQKTFFKYVWIDYHKAKNTQITGNTDAGSISVLIFASSTIATDEGGNIRTYASPLAFKNATLEEQSQMWTLKENDDFLAIGNIAQDIDPTKNNKIKLYTVNAIYPCYSSDGIHHWEVTGN